MVFISLKVKFHLVGSTENNYALHIYVIHIIFSKFLKRTYILQNFVKQELPSIAPTRWNFTSQLGNTLKSNQDKLILFFEYMDEISNDQNSVLNLKAQGFLHFLEIFLSQFLLNILYSSIFSFIVFLFVYFKLMLWIAFYIKKGNEIIIKLQEMHDNDFEKIFNGFNLDNFN